MTSSPRRVLGRKLKQPRARISGIVRRLVHSLDVEVHGKDQVLRALAAYEAGPGDFADHPIGEINRAAGCSTTFTHDRGAGKVGSLTLLKA